MRIEICLAAAFLGLATACAGVAAGADQDTAFVPEAARWKDIMEDVIGPVYDDYLVREAERSDGPMDLPTIATQALRAADHMELGHGIHEWKVVPRFGTYARESEAWLRSIAAAARAGQAEQVRGLILDGQLEHCDRCHAACQ
jgi:hypothetical protein